MALNRKYNHVDYVRKYDKKNTRTFAIKLNNKTDKDLIDSLLSTDNKQLFIKKSMRFYIKHKNQFGEE